MKDPMLFYIENGFRLFPLQDNSKKPQVKWKDNATDNYKIARYYKNYGAVIPDDVIIIDIDVHDGTMEGFETYNRYSKAFPETFTVMTPSGGMHVYYRVDRKIGRSIELYHNIDLLSNGYVVGVGSSFDGEFYKIEKDLPIAAANKAVYDFIDQAIKKPDHSSNDIKNKDLDTIEKGSRNDKLFKLACKLRSIGSLSDRAILQAIWQENVDKCDPKLEKSEVISIVKSALKYDPEEKDDIKSLIDKVISMDQVEEKEQEWLIDGLIPKYATTIIGAQGGIGKSTLWMSLFASLSSGTKFFTSDQDIEEQKVMFFSSEDSLNTVVKPRLRKMAAKMENIITVPNSIADFNKITFESELLEGLIKAFRPSVVVFDPLQSFVGKDVNMGSQNAMRSTLQPLKALEQTYNVTFIIVCHTNKRNSLDPRDRLSNSGDIWDISRSVLMLGQTIDNELFLSQEKNNYGVRSDTIVYQIVDGKPEFIRHSDKRFYDFMYEKATQKPKSDEGKQTKKDLAKEIIIKVLRETPTKTAVSAVLEEEVKESGVSKQTFLNAKADLSKEGTIKAFPEIIDGKKTWYVKLIEDKEEKEENE